MRLGRFTFTRDRTRCESCGRGKTWLVRYQDTATGREFWRCRDHTPADVDFTGLPSIVATAIRGRKR